MNTQAHSLLLDSQALSAAARAQRSMHPWLEFARQSDSILYISAVTLAETTDGSPRDANVRRMVNTLRVIPATDTIGYGAGRLRSLAAQNRRKARDLTIDAIVAATALTLPTPAVVITSDPEDLRLLLQDTSVRVAGIGG